MSIGMSSIGAMPWAAAGAGVSAVVVTGMDFLRQSQFSKNQGVWLQSVPNIKVLHPDHSAKSSDPRVNPELNIQGFVGKPNADRNLASMALNWGMNSIILGERGGFRIHNYSPSFFPVLNNYLSRYQNVELLMVPGDGLSHTHTTAYIINPQMLKVAFEKHYHKPYSEEAVKQVFRQREHVSPTRERFMADVFGIPEGSLEGFLAYRQNSDQLHRLSKQLTSSHKSKFDQLYKEALASSPTKFPKKIQKMIEVVTKSELLTQTKARLIELLEQKKQFPEKSFRGCTNAGMIFPDINNPTDHYYNAQTPFYRDFGGKSWTDVQQSICDWARHQLSINNT